jgi:hypothetical protein
LFEPLLGLFVVRKGLHGNGRGVEPEKYVHDELSKVGVGNHGHRRVNGWQHFGSELPGLFVGHRGIAQVNEQRNYPVLGDLFYQGNVMGDVFNGSLWTLGYRYQDAIMVKPVSGYLAFKYLDVMWWCWQNQIMRFDIEVNKTFGTSRAGFMRHFHDHPTTSTAR